MCPDVQVKLSGLRKAGLPAAFSITSSPISSSPFASNNSETPKSHSLTTVLSFDIKTLSGLIWYQRSLMNDNRTALNTYISMNDSVYVQVFEAQYQLSEVFSSLTELEWRSRGIRRRAHCDVHEYSARHVLQDKEQRVGVWHRY